MGIFDRHMVSLNDAAATLRKLEAAKKEEEARAQQDEIEWIWVDGYKGTDANLRCRGFQYEIGKQFDMPVDVEVEACERGFHLCRDLKDVFGYYGIGKNNRFFEVRALVSKKDFEKYGRPTVGMFGYYGIHQSKLVAKSIEFIRELTVEEVFAVTDYSDWTDKNKRYAMATSIDAVKNMAKIDKLIEAGYSETFSRYVAEKMGESRYDRALAVASLPDLSMDMKVFAIMNDD